MLRQLLAFAFAAAFAASAQTYTGPEPPKPDLPYLKHAETLLPVEATEAKEEKGKGKKDEIIYAIPGPDSPARTPLASPIFLFKSEKLEPGKLQLYKPESRNGRRELLAGPKRPLKPIRLDVTRLSGSLYRIEVNESLEKGEYCLSPEGSNAALCFQVY